jgi:hypothetical protein
MVTADAQNVGLALLHKLQLNDAWIGRRAKNGRSVVDQGIATLKAD